MLTSTIQRLDGNANPIPGLLSSGFLVTHSHATAATATKAAVATSKHVITGFAVGTDLAGALVQLKSGTDVIFACSMIAGHFALSGLNIELALNKAATVTVNSTSAGNANLMGYTLNPMP
jgi:hypothetical protein